MAVSSASKIKSQIPFGAFQVSNWMVHMGLTPKKAIIAHQSYSANAYMKEKLFKF